MPEKQEVKKTVKKAVVEKSTKKSATKELIKSGINLPDPLANLSTHIQRQKAVMEFVKKNLQEGVDYGKMWPGDKKKNIYISGCEKVNDWLLMVERPFPHWDAWKMLGEDKNTICLVDYGVRISDVPLIDELIRKYGVENEQMAYRMVAVATGFGAATIDGTTVKDRNVAMKKSHIRARKDMTLALGLHNEFTQERDEYGENVEGDNNGYMKPKAKSDVSEKQEAPPSESTAPTEGEPVKSEIETLYDSMIEMIQHAPQNTRKIFEQKGKEAIAKNNIANMKALEKAVSYQAKHWKQGA